MSERTEFGLAWGRRRRGRGLKNRGEVRKKSVAKRGRKKLGQDQVGETRGEFPAGISGTMFPMGEAGAVHVRHAIPLVDLLGHSLLILLKERSTFMERRK
jgi:hypothetical protein